MISLKYFSIFVALVIIGGFSEIAYGHGLGNVESDILFFNDSFFKIKVKTTPDVLSGNETEIGFEISTINDDQKTLVSNVEYGVEIFDAQSGNLLLSFDAFSSDDHFNAKIIPDSVVNFSGETNENGAWIGSNLDILEINAPLFLQGGLIQVNVTILSINGDTISQNSTFETLLTIGEYIPFEIIFDDETFDFMFATYFDKIDEFSFDERNKKLTALMPFNWNPDFTQKIPFVHAEYYIPKSMDVFNYHEIKMTVNDIPILGTIDRSGDEEIVVHFLIPTKKLLKLYDEISDDDHDKIIFGIQSGKFRDVQKDDASLELGDKVIVLSSQEDWKFHLSLTPKGQIFAQDEINLNLEFHDSVTNTLISQITYDLDILLNGQQIESNRGLETPDGRDSIPVIFPKSGSVIVQISNVNNFDTTGEFSFKVGEPKNTLIFDKIVDISDGSSFPGCEIDDSCYLSSDVKITLDKTVLWKNIDSAAHTVTSGSPENGILEFFDSGIITPSNNFSYKFETIGNFSYFCTLHPWMIGTISVSDGVIPSWIKNNAGWWADGTIDDNSFIQGIQFLIKEGIMEIPPTTKDSSSGTNEIPSWIKNNAGWWADGTIDDNSFIQGIQFLVEKRILNVD